jgi:hypothetical protein
VQGFGNYVGLAQLPGKRPELPSKTWIRREFHYFGSKLPENPVFAPKYLQQSLDFSQS